MHILCNLGVYLYVFTAGKYWYLLSLLTGFLSKNMQKMHKVYLCIIYAYFCSKNRWAKHVKYAKFYAYFMHICKHICLKYAILAYFMLNMQKMHRICIISIKYLHYIWRNRDKKCTKIFRCKRVELASFWVH